MNSDEVMQAVNKHFPSQKYCDMKHEGVTAYFKAIVYMFSGIIVLLTGIIVKGLL